MKNYLIALLELAHTINMVIVTGTGRSGTSLIAKWLDEIGLLEYKSNWIPQFNAGLEPTDVSRVNGAIWIGNDPEYQQVSVQKQKILEFDYQIIKDPKFFYGNVLDTWLSVRNDLKFLICLRKFTNVYKSRMKASQLAMARKPEQLEHDLGRFISQLVFNDLKFEIIKFPDFIDNFYEEVWTKTLNLYPQLSDIPYDVALETWQNVADKKMVHHI